MTFRKHIEKLTFSPSRLTGNRHVQTFLAMLETVQESSVPSIQHHIPVSDGDMICCEVSQPKQWDLNLPTAFLLHGLGGSHLSSYMVRMALKLMQQLSCRVVRINLRGCGSGVHLAKRPYHAGLSDDLWQILNYFHVQSPSFLIAYSIGANIALKMAGEHGDSLKPYLKTLIAICPPFYLDRCLKKLTKTPLGFYERYLANQVRQQYESWAKHHPEVRHAIFPKRMSLLNFDQLHTAPCWGFLNAYDYYDKSSCAPWIQRISIPCHIFCTADDPIVDSDSVHELPLGESVKIWLSPKGGHMGFIDLPRGGQGGHWLDRTIIELLNNSFSIY